MIAQTTSPTGQYIRYKPGLEFSPIGIAEPDAVVTVERFANDSWAEVMLGDLRGFMMRSYLREITEVVAEFGHAAVGIHGPDANKSAWLDGVNYQHVRSARPEGMKLLCAGDADGEIVENLRREGVQKFMMRVYAPLTSKQSGLEVMREFIQPLTRLYAAGVRYIEIGNEPNLYNGAGGSQEGMGVVWKNGREFAEWWMDAAAYLRSIFPDAKLGFSAMSPGPEIPGFRYSPDLFMTEANEAVQAADWIAEHVYWQDDHVGAALAEVGAFARRYPHKEVLITEFANTSFHISMEWKGDQYVEFYRRSKLLPRNVGGSFCFVLDNKGFPEQSWRESRIAEIVGSRDF